MGSNYNSGTENIFCNEQLFIFIRKLQHILVKAKGDCLFIAVGLIALNVSLRLSQIRLKVILYLIGKNCGYCENIFCSRNLDSSHNLDNRALNFRLSQYWRLTLGHWKLILGCPLRY